MTTELAEPGTAGLWHGALFHRSAAEFEDAASRFAEAAARAGAAVLVACPGQSLTRLRARMDGLGGRVTWADMASMGTNPGRLIHEISRFVDQHAGRAIWCIQQAVWPSRSEQELWEVLRHEALLNLALAGAPVRVLCPYQAALPGEMIACAEATHPMTAHGGHWLPSDRFRPDAAAPVPAECDQPLPPPPVSAQTLPYHDDLSPVRRLVTQHAKAADLPPSRADDLLIAIGELGANTLSHASGQGTLTLWETASEVICQVHDSGYITDPLAGRLRPSPAAPVGGRGLWLVHQLCDLVQVRTGAQGTTIRVHMQLT